VCVGDCRDVFSKWPCYCETWAVIVHEVNIFKKTGIIPQILTDVCWVLALLVICRCFTCIMGSVRMILFYVHMTAKRRGPADSQTASKHTAVSL